MLVMWYISSEYAWFAFSNEYGLAYVLGIYYAELADCVKEVKKSRICGAAVVIAAAAAFYLLTNMDGVHVTIFEKNINFWLLMTMYHVFLLLGMIVFFMISSYISRSIARKPFIWLGNISYMTYLLHGAFLVFTLRTFEGVVNPWLTYVVGAAACLLLGTLYIYRISDVIGRQHG